MAAIITDNKNYSDIAEAIRAKTKSSRTYKPSEMAAAIEGISSSGFKEISQEWEVTEYHYYDQFPHFLKVYNLPIQSYECTIYNFTFENNTDNTRAGKYVDGMIGKTINGDDLNIEKGVRVGGTIGGFLGLDVYPGCKIILTQKAYLKKE